MPLLMEVTWCLINLAEASDQAIATMGRLRIHNKMMILINIHNNEFIENAFCVVTNRFYGWWLIYVVDP